MGNSAQTPIDRVIESLYRTDWAKILATLVRQTRDLDAAEDAVQEAMSRAIASWETTGIPENPAGWISVAAKRIAIDSQRRASTLQGKLPLLIVPEDDDTSLHLIDLAFGDDRLRLIFTCCHPVLAPEARLALTLRMICGLTTTDIAALFLVQEPTMAARITRAKRKLSASGVPFHIPAPADIEARLQDVLAVVYLVATAAHTPPQGIGLHNATNMRLALDLTAMLQELVPGHPEVIALRALVMMADARKDSRLDAADNALPLEHMDRSLWDQATIAQAIILTEESLGMSSIDMVGSYTLQAAIAAVHAEAPSYEETDWSQIVALYTILNHRHPGAVVQLGRAIAIGMRDGPKAGLANIQSANLDDALATYPMLPAARAHLYRQLGEAPQAAEHYRLAADRTSNETLQRWFLSQAERLSLRD